MAYARTSPHWCTRLSACVLLLALLVVFPSRCQERSAGTVTVQNSENPLTQDLTKYPGLPEEFGVLLQQWGDTVHFPAARQQSRLLPTLPPSTMAYIALSNYGDVADSALKVFHQELQKSSVLRDWWTHGSVAANAPKIEDAVEKFAQLHQFLGDEVAVSVAMDGKEPAFMLVSEVRKPGLKKFIEQWDGQLSGKGKSAARVLEPAELPTAPDKRLSEEFLVLVRPDFVVAAPNLAALRSFAARVDSRNGDFPASPFGRRILKEYQNGVTVLAAFDLRKVLERSSPFNKKDATFQYSGFAEMQYALWDHTTLAGKEVSQMELSFTSPRHGIASWLAKPRPLTTLDFVPPHTLFAVTLVLADPSRIYEDVQELERLSNSNSLAAVPAFEQMLKLSLKDDLLSLLTGEITVELDSFTLTQPVWKATLALKDASHMEQTLNTLIAAGHLDVDSVSGNGVTYSTVRIPSGNKVNEITYAFVDSHLLIGSSRDAIAEAVHLHHSGESLANSPKFLAALPPGHSLEASALMYENPLLMSMAQFRGVGSAMKSFLSNTQGEAIPGVSCFYGEESAIREISSNQAFDIAGVLVGAAVAIPNLLRSRIAANEASAAGSVRTVNTAEAMYTAAYPKKGFAADLASLGTDPTAPNAASPLHAGYIDPTLGCTGSEWCVKQGYRFQVKALCKQGACTDYVVVATPVSAQTGTRNFCSTSDGVIHWEQGAPLTAAPSIAECRTWRPLQ